MIQMSRLPGRSVKGFGWSFQRNQLWLSPEYLLSREIFGYREEVKRYYYGDIQAIVSGPTLNWRLCNIVTGITLLVLGSLAAYLLVAEAPGPLTFLAAMAVGIVGIVLSGNLILGPTCRTILYTATSEAPLPSLGRQRSARKAINQILPFIEAAQGSEHPGSPSADSPESVPESPAPESAAAGGDAPGPEHTL
jgi:hypothetical protein